MEAIFPITALQRKQKEVKEAARKGIVRITEQGMGAYIFSSEEEYEKAIRNAKDEGAYEARLYDAVSAGRADIEAQNVHTDIEALFDRVRKRIGE